MACRTENRQWRVVRKTANGVLATTLGIVKKQCIRLYDQNFTIRQGVHVMQETVINNANINNSDANDAFNAN